MIRKIHSLPRKASMEESWAGWRGGAAHRLSRCHSPFLRRDLLRLRFREFIQLLYRGQAWKPEGAPKRWDEISSLNKSLYEKIRKYWPQARVSEGTVQRRRLRSSIFKRGENGALGFMSSALAHLTVQCGTSKWVYPCYRCKDGSSATQGFQGHPSCGQARL